MINHRPSAVSEAIAVHLVRSRGTEAQRVFSIIQSAPELAKPIIEGSMICAAEISVASEEFVVHLDDVLMRRTEAALLSEFDDKSLQRSGELVAGALNWPKQKLHAEIDRAQAVRERHSVAQRAGQQ
jgi:glycerol-3-phosphate dehydrogenase